METTTCDAEIPHDSKPTDTQPIKKSILERPRTRYPKPNRPKGRPKKEEHEQKVQS